MSISQDETKVLPVVTPQAIVNGASWMTTEIDAIGFEHATWYFLLGATDAAITALKLTESDTSGSGHADITGTRFGTDPNDTGATSALPSAADDGKLFVVDLDLRGRKRFIDAVATIGTGTTGGFLAAWCVLSRGHDTPVTAADRNAAELLRV